MMDGEYRFLKKFDFSYIVLVKRYSVNCYFNIEVLDGFTKPKIIKQISFFDDPIENPDPDWRSKYISSNPNITYTDKCN